MEPDKNLKEDQHTEELPIVEDVVYHHENEEDTLDEPVEKPVRMTPITVDLDDAEKYDIHIGMSEKKAETKKEEPETIDKKPANHKKKTWIFIVLAVVCVICIGGYLLISNYEKQQQAKQAAYDKIYNQLKVTFKEDEKDADGNKVDLTIYEYGVEANDPLSIVDTHYGDIQCNPSTIDTSKVGTQKLVYTVSMNDSYGQKVTRDFSLNITVHDTQSPQITLKESKVTITEGDAFDAADNIESVKDAVDGDLQFVETEPEKEGKNAPYYSKGWYTISSDVDTETPGSYNVRLKACDINGNATDLAFSVTVKKKEPSSFMTIGTRTYTQALGQMNERKDEASEGQGKWEDVNSYLGNVLYRSDVYDNQETMMNDGQQYVKDHFDDLTKNKESKSLQIIGKISIDTKEATLYYMSALDDNGEVMYYFYAIV